MKRWPYSSAPKAFHLPASIVVFQIVKWHREFIEWTRKLDLKMIESNNQYSVNLT